MEHGRILGATVAVIVAMSVTGGAAQASGLGAARGAGPVSWAGFYGGLSFSQVSGHALNSRYIGDFGTTNGAGGFVGYNWQNAGFVIGGELNYINFDTTYGLPYIRQGNSLEVRARAGYAFRNVLVYGVLGGARSSMTAGGSSDSLQGLVYGVGAEAMVTNAISVGVELARREVYPSGTTYNGSQIDTISMRFGYHF